MKHLVIVIPTKAAKILDGLGLLDDAKGYASLRGFRRIKPEEV